MADEADTAGLFPELLIALAPAVAQNLKESISMVKAYEDEEGIEEAMQQLDQSPWSGYK